MARQEVKGNLPGLIVPDVETARRLLRRRRRSSRPAPEGQIRRWWVEKGRDPFVLGAEIWRAGQAADIADISGQSVEWASGRMNQAESEERLKKVFRGARLMRLSALEVAERLTNEAVAAETRLQGQANWVRSYLNWVIELLGDEYRLNQEKRKALGIVTLQP